MTHLPCAIVFLQLKKKKKEKYKIYKKKIANKKNCFCVCSVGIW